MITELKKGEIVRIDNKEFIIITKKGYNGFMDFDVYRLVLLDNFYKREKLRKEKNHFPNFRSIKLTYNLKGGKKNDNRRIWRKFIYTSF